MVMATITRYPFVRHLNGSATSYVQHLKGGRVTMVNISSVGALQMAQQPPTPEPTYVAVAHTTASVNSAAATAP